MPIPKIVHYCWFGPKHIPALEVKCIESWKNFLPDYKFQFWNETTFDINSFNFTREAYDKKYFAFISDFIRAFALNKYGGIYLDADVELLSNISSLLKNKKAVLGFENSTFIGTALMAFTANHPIMTNLQDYYNSNSFMSANGHVNITGNPVIFSEILKKYGVLLNGKDQLVNGVHVFNRNVFFPKKLSENEFRINKETVAIHHFSGSWLTPRQKRRGQNKIWIEVCRPILRSCQNTISLIFGKRRTKDLERHIRNLLK